MVGIILAVLEKITEDDFVCPCDWPYNISICVLYGGVPSIVCFFYTLCFMDLSPNTQDRRTKDNSGTNNTNDSMPQSAQLQDRGTEKICTCERIIYSIFTACIWLCIFLADGRYFACAFSDWEGVYAKNESFGILKWCKPIGNETSELESQLITLKWMCRSQVSSELNPLKTNRVLIFSILLIFLSFKGIFSLQTHH